MKVWSHWNAPYLASGYTIGPRASRDPQVRRVDVVLRDAPRRDRWSDEFRQHKEAQRAFKTDRR